MSCPYEGCEQQVYKPGLAEPADLGKILRTL